MPAANGHEVSSQSHLLEVVGTRQPAAACCLLPAWTWTTTTKISVCATSTPPHHHRPPRGAGHRQTRTTIVTSVPRDPATQRYSFPSGAPRLASLSLPHRRSGLCLLCLVQGPPVRWTDISLPETNHRILLRLCRLSPSHPPFVQYSSADLGIPKSPITVFSKRTRIDETRHQPAVTVSGGQTKTNTNLHLHSRQ